MFEKGWKVEVIRAGGRCFFGNGWLEFVRDCKIEVGDRLILFHFAVTGVKTMNTIIVRKNEDIASSSEGKPYKQPNFLTLIYEYRLIFFCL